MLVVVLCFANCVVLYFIVFFILTFNANILFIYYNYTVQRHEQRCYTLDWRYRRNKYIIISFDAVVGNKLHLLPLLRHALEMT